MAAVWRQRSALRLPAGGVSAGRVTPALVAQWIEQRFPKPRVGGSIPPGGTATCRDASTPPGPIPPCSGTSWITDKGFYSYVECNACTGGWQVPHYVEREPC